jgi:hypothetical protein
VGKFGYHTLSLDNKNILFRMNSFCVCIDMGTILFNKHYLSIIIVNSYE